MIRFSAALVAVAIGVLLGGIATSKLLLVYIAIVVSAVALVALAIGVVLKREELFGDEQGLVPAPAGASPVLPARADESQGKVPAGAHVSSPPPYAGAAGYAAFGGNTPSAPAGVDRSGRPAPSGQGRSAGTASARPTTANPVPANPVPANPVPAGTVSANAVPANTGLANTGPANTGPAGAVPPWEATPARGPWSSSAADWMPSEQDERAAGAGTQGGRAGGWRSAEADAQAAARAPRSWAAPSSSAPSSTAPSSTGAPEAPPVTPAAAPASAAPSWFDRLGGPTGTDLPTVPPGSGGGGWPWSSREGGEPGGPAVPEDTTGTDGAATAAAPAIPGDTLPGDTASSGTAADAGTAAGAADEDDWPARYSWLDDDTDDTNEAGAVTGTAGDTAPGDGETPHRADDTARAVGAPATVAAPTADAPVAPTADAPVAPPAAETVSVPVLGTETQDDDPADSPAAEDGADIIAFPGPGAAAEPGTASDEMPDEPASEASLDGEAEGEPPTTADEDDAEAGPALVTVVPGVPRYHRTDCVLIRFMPAGDVHQVPVSEATDAGCTPCAACQPEG